MSGEDARLIALLRNAAPEIVAMLEALTDWRYHPVSLFDALDALDRKVPSV
jgi:hypothetical protein